MLFFVETQSFASLPEPECAGYNGEKLARRLTEGDVCGSFALVRDVSFR